MSVWVCFDLCRDYGNEVVVCLCRTHVDDTESVFGKASVSSAALLRTQSAQVRLRG